MSYTQPPVGPLYLAVAFLMFDKKELWAQCWGVVALIVAIIDAICWIGGF